VELLPFAQLDLPGELPLADGRYLVRPPDDPEARPDVLVLRKMGAPRARSRLRRGRPQAVAEDPPATPLPLSRITLVKAIPFKEPGAAERWLKEVSGNDELAKGLAREVSATVNRAILAHRVAAPDPYAADVHPGAAVAVRFGYGSGDEVAAGRWQAARELPEGRRRSLRSELIDGVGAQERIAAVLGGRDQVSAAESLLLSAEHEKAEGRLALALATLDAALRAAQEAGADASEAVSALAEARDATSTDAPDVPSDASAGADAVHKAIRAARRAISAQRR
jgi:hypothetical protein